MKTKKLLLFFLLVSIYTIGYCQNSDLMPYLKGNLYGYANADGKIIVAPKYTFTRPFINGIGQFLLCERLGTNNRYGLIDHTGKVILEPIASRIHPFDTNGLAIIELPDNKKGIINNNGNWIVPSQNAHVEIVGQFIRIQTYAPNPQSALLDLKGNTIIDFKYETFQFQDEQSSDTNWVIGRKNNHFSLIQIQEEKAEVKIPLQESLSFFNDSLLRIRQEGKLGLNTYYGKSVIPVRYDQIKKVKHGILVKEKLIKIGLSILLSSKDIYKYSLYNHFGQLIIPAQFGRFEMMESNLIKVRSEKGLIIYNSKGQILTSYEYDRVYEARENLMVVKIQLDSTERVQSDKHNGAIVTRKRFKCGFMDRAGRLIIPMEYEAAFSFHQNCAAVKKNGKWGLINKFGRPITEFKYDGLQYAGDNRYAFRKKNLWGLLNLNGQETMPATYGKYKRVPYRNNPFGNSSAITFENGLAPLYKTLAENTRAKKTYIDTNGTQLFPLIYTNIEILEEELFKVEWYVKELDSDRIGMVDKNNKVVIPIEQREIKWLIIEQVYQVLTENRIYIYYNKKGSKIDSPYKNIEHFGFRYYRQIANGFYAANTKGKTVYFTPKGILLYEE